MRIGQLCDPPRLCDAILWLIGFFRLREGLLCCAQDACAPRGLLLGGLRPLPSGKFLVFLGSEARISSGEATHTTSSGRTAAADVL